jgi:hypothetical protein
MEKWYDIAGFSKYEASSGCVLRRKKDGTIVNARKRNRGAADFFQLTSDRGTRYSVSEARLFYCAVKNINPKEVDSSYRFFFREGCEKRIENIVIREPWEVGKIIKNKQLQHQIPKDTYYSQCIDFSKAVLSNDTEAMLDCIRVHESEIKRCIRKYVVSGDRVDRIYHKITADILVGVSEGRFLMTHPLSYIKTYIRKLVRNSRQRYKIE